MSRKLTKKMQAWAANFRDLTGFDSPFLDQYTDGNRGSFVDLVVRPSTKHWWMHSLTVQRSIEHY